MKLNGQFKGCAGTRHDTAYPQPIAKMGNPDKVMARRRNSGKCGPLGNPRDAIGGNFNYGVEYGLCTLDVLDNQKEYSL